MRVQIRYNGAMDTETELPEFARRVRGLLADRDWSAAELARRSGLHPGTVSNILKGRHPNPTRKMAATVAAAFGVSVEDLYSGGAPKSAIDEMGMLLGQLSGRRVDWAREMLSMAPRLSVRQQQIILEQMREMVDRSQPGAAQEDLTPEPSPGEKTVSEELIRPRVLPQQPKKRPAGVAKLVDQSEDAPDRASG